MVSMVGGIFGILGFVAAGLVYLRMGMAKTTIELLEKNNDTLSNRVTILENEGRDKDRQLAKQDGEITALKAEREMLRELATGRSAVDTLSSHVDARFDEVKSLLTKLTQERRS